MLAFERSFSRQLRLQVAVAMLMALTLTTTVPSLSAASKAPSVEWSKTFSGWWSKSVIQTEDGGYAILGYSETYLRTVLIKTDLSGELQWEKYYGTDVFEDGNAAVSVVQTWDLGYVLLGTGGIVVKTDKEGNVQSKNNLDVGEVSFGIQASDGRFLLVGNKKTNGENVAWLLKTDEKGSIIWNKPFTGGFFVEYVIETNDHGCAIAGNWNNNFWLAKIDSNSNLEWTHTYPYGGFLDFHFVSSVARTKDGGYLLAGGGDWQTSGGIVPWLIEINFHGNANWSMPYEHIPNNSFTSVVQADDNGYILAFKNSPDLIKTDISGSEQWTLRYADISGETGSPSLLGSTLIRTKDGGFVVASTDFRKNILLTKISSEHDTFPPVVSISSPKSKTYETGDIPLTFTLNEPASWVGYSLNGQDNLTIAGNTTLSGLSVNAYDLIVYATDESGKTGASATIHFSLVDRFPIEWIIVSIITVAAIGVCLLVYFKKQSLLANKKQSLMGCVKKWLFAVANNNIVKNLILIGLCIIMVLVQFFFPYFYFSSLAGNSTSTFELGISYVYERDNIGQIYDEVSRIKDLGFKIIRVNMVCDPNDPNDYSNSLTDVFFDASQYYNIRVALVIQNHGSTDEIIFYLDHWGKYLSYVQILNEPELSSSWDIGALFTDDEIISRFEQVYSIIEKYDLPLQLYTNFGAGFVVRSNLPIKLSENLDFVGFDVFMDSFLTLSPNFVQLLRKITNKNVVITEFGMSTSDDTAQSDFIIRGLNLFKSMGLKGCWIVYWNSVENNYGIRERLAEKTIGEWIAQNTKTV